MISVAYIDFLKKKWYNKNVLIKEYERRKNDKYK